MSTRARCLSASLLVLRALLAAGPAGAQDAVPEPRLVASDVRIPVVESNDLRVRRISTADGLSQTRVAQIIQDDRGFIWFGTQFGLNRYDGYDFKIFVHDPASTNSLSGTFVTALFKDRDGALWIGCSESLDRMDPRTEAFTHYTVDSQAPSGPVVHISQDRSGMLWLSTGTGLHRLNPTTGEITHFRHDPTRPDSLATNDINWTGEDRSGHFWVGSASGLDEFDRATARVTYHVPIADSVRVRFYEDRLGKFWVVSALGTGLALLDRAANTLTKYTFYAEPPPSGELSGIRGIIEDREGDLWLGSPRMGLMRLDREHFSLVHYGTRPGDSRSIADNQVSDLFGDRDDNIWIGLNANGPNVFARTTLPFETFRHNPADPQSLTLDFVNAIYEDPQGLLWIGNDDGLNAIDRINHRRRMWSTALGAKPMVISIAGESSGKVWFGTFGYGLSRLDPGTGGLVTYRHDARNPRSLSNDQVHQLLIDRSGTLWVGTDDGLDRYDPKSDDFTVYRMDPSDRRAQAYITMDEDEAGTLWLGTHYSGLHHFDPRSGRFIQIYRAGNRPDSLRDDVVPSIRVARSGHIWIGTENGLNELDPRTGRLRGYDAHDGLPGNAVRCILEDDGGDLWLGTNHGLSHFSLASGRFVNYSEDDGLPGDDLSGWYACYHRKGREMFMGGFPGAFAFRPEQLHVPVHVPSVVLTDFRLSGHHVPIGAHTPLKESISYTDSITLSHSQPVFTVEFAGFNYAAPRTTRYRYRLDGLDQQWTEVSSEQRFATYTTLPAGAYSFRVEAAMSRGSWSPNSASLRIEILPPWWRTWWFRTFYLSALLLVLYSIHLLRLRQTAREFAMRLQERVDERTRIAQELHDTLLQGLLSASLQLEIANSDISPDHPVKAQTNAVFGMIRQLIDEGRNTLRGLRSPRRSAVEGLGDAFARAPEELMVASGARFRLVTEGEPRPLRPLVSDEVYRIGREALSNAFRHSGGSTVELVLEYAQHHFRVVIRDDGKGIPLSVLALGKAGHWGLSGMRERASRIKGKFKIRSAPNAGTEIDLVIPAGAAYERMTAPRWRDWLAKLYSHGANQ
jgi:signal transduction histidine kinase/ligand-binding sensor domain-containing protein